MSLHAAPANILLADDDDAVRKVLARALSSQGYIVHAAADGEQAAKAFEAAPFDLVLSDIDMPGRNGVELLKVIRERDLDVPVVLLTGSPTLESALLAIEHGASHYLTKPIDLPGLHATIRRALQAGRLARARRDLVPLAGEAALQTRTSPAWPRDSSRPWSASTWPGSRSCAGPIDRSSLTRR